MKVILLKNVPKVGQKYDVKNVADGYALNFLIPQKLAEVATSSAVKKIEVLKSADQTQKKVQEDLLLKNLESVNLAKIELTEKANDKGHLFSGIHKEQLIAALKDQAHLDLSADFIDLSKPIKEVGEHKVVVKVGDKKAEFSLTIKATQ